MKTYFFKSLLDISVDILKQLNTECVLLDIDNTIKPYGADSIDSKYVNWINNVKAYGIRVVLCSNNFYKNVRPIAELAAKPPHHPLNPLNLLNLFRVQSNGDTPRRLNLTPTTFVLYLYTRKYLWYRKTSKNKQRN